MRLTIVRNSNNFDTITNNEPVYKKRIGIDRIKRIVIWFFVFHVTAVQHYFDHFRCIISFFRFSMYSTSNKTNTFMSHP